MLENVPSEGCNLFRSFNAGKSEGDKSMKGKKESKRG
jgi:hypothetical protein